MGIPSIYNTIQNQSDITCADYFKKIKCDSIFPQCSSDGKTLTYRNISNVCEQFRSQCSNKSLIPSECRYSRPSNLDSVYNLTDCIRPTTSLHLHGSDCPATPKDLTIPRWLNDERSLTVSILPHLPSTLESNGVPNSCIKNVLRYGCHEVPFCSANRIELLSAGNIKSCQQALKW